MNTPIVGRIYHVVDKTTGEVVKVGSTIKSLEHRFKGYDYVKKYTNHFLREAKIIKSDDLDWYDPTDPFCPFLWHLVASEHLEILNTDTFRKTRFSNLQSPLDQKYFGFDGSVAGKIGGKMNAEDGTLTKARRAITPERKVGGGKKAGKMAADSGRVSDMGFKGGSISGPKNGRRLADEKIGMFGYSDEEKRQVCSKGGLIAGKKNAENKIGFFGFSKEKRIEINKLAAHIQWHIIGSYNRRGERNWIPPKPNPRCIHCSEESLIIAYA